MCMPHKTPEQQYGSTPFREICQSQSTAQRWSYLVSIAHCCFEDIRPNHIKIPSAAQTTSFTYWSVVSLYKILSKFSLDNSSSSSSGSKVSSTKSAAARSPVVSAERNDAVTPRRTSALPPRVGEKAEDDCCGHRARRRPVAPLTVAPCS